MSDETSHLLPPERQQHWDTTRAARLDILQAVTTEGTGTSAPSEEAKVPGAGLTVGGRYRQM
jgi:hypothetical protein